MSNTRFNPNTHIADVARRMVAYCRQAEKGQIETLLRDVLETYKASNWRPSRIDSIQYNIDQLASQERAAIDVVQALLSDKEGGVKNTSYKTLLLRALSKQIPEIDPCIEISEKFIPDLCEEFIQAIPSRVEYERLAAQEQHDIALLSDVKEQLQNEIYQSQQELNQLKQDILDKEKELVQKNLVFLNLITKIQDLIREELEKSSHLEMLKLEIGSAWEQYKELLTSIENKTSEWKDTLEKIMQEMEEKEGQLNEKRRYFMAIHPEIDYKKVPLEVLESARKYAQEALDVWLVNLILNQNRNKAQEVSVRQKEIIAKPKVECTMQLIYGDRHADEAIKEENKLYLYYLPEEDTIAYAVKQATGIERIKIDREELHDHFEGIRNVLKDASTRRQLSPRDQKAFFDVAAKQGYVQKIDVKFDSNADRVIKNELNNISKQRDNVNTSHIKQLLMEMHKLTTIKQEKDKLDQEKKEQQLQVQELQKVQEQKQEEKRQQEAKTQNLSKHGAHATVKQPQDWRAVTVAMDKSYYATEVIESVEEKKQIAEEQASKRRLLAEGLQLRFNKSKLFGNKDETLKVETVSPPVVSNRGISKIVSK